jgi:hypothetical protein
LSVRNKFFVSEKQGGPTSAIFIVGIENKNERYTKKGVEDESVVPKLTQANK